MIVKHIWERNGVTLIEWLEDGEPKRSIVPSKDVVDRECVYPERGLPYGVDFSRYITIEVTPEDIAQELRKAGIWTIDDVLRNPRAVQSAFDTAFGVVLQELLGNMRSLSRIKEL